MNKYVVIFFVLIIAQIDSGKGVQCQDTFSRSYDLGGFSDSGVAILSVGNGKRLILSGSFCNGGATNCLGYFLIDAQGDLIWKRSVNTYTDNRMPVYNNPLSFLQTHFRCYP